MAVIVIIFAPKVTVVVATVVASDHEFPPPPFESATVAPRPINERSAVTDTRLLFGSDTVHVSVVEVVPFAGTLTGRNAHPEIVGGGSVTVSVAVVVGLLVVSAALTVMVFAPNVVIVVDAVVASVQVLPLPPFESAAVALRPIGERSAVTAELLFGSDTVQVNVVDVVPSAGTLTGANAHPEIVGGGSVTVSVVVAVGLLTMSFAVMVIVFAPNVAVVVAAVVASVKVFPLPPFDSAAVALRPIGERSAVTDCRLLFGSITVHVSVVEVVPFAATLAGANAHPEIVGGGSVTVSVAGEVKVLPVSFAVTVILLDP